MILTYYDGSGYKRIPVIHRGDRFSGSDNEHNYVIDSRQFIIVTDGKEPINWSLDYLAVRNSKMIVSRPKSSASPHGQAALGGIALK